MVWNQGDTLTYRCMFKTDFDGVAYTPNTIDVVICDNLGVTKASLTLISTGVYEFQYTLPSNAATGYWPVTIYATDSNNRVSNSHCGFRVERRPTIETWTPQ